MFPYRCILVTGATSGIGRALSERFVNNGAFVIAVGRRQDRLDELATTFGPDKIATEAFDVTNIAELPAWISKMVDKYPIDAAVLNAGVQHKFNLSKPETVSLDKITSELNGNHLSPVHSTVLLLPHLQALSKSKPVAIIYVTSGLALVPSFTCLTYSATKSALHSFVWGARTQLETEYPNLKIIEIVPPAVKTELHTKQGLNQIGMELNEYIDGVWKGLLEGKDEIRTGVIFQRGLKADDERKAAFEEFNSILKAQGRDK